MERTIFYKGGKRGEDEIVPNDDAAIISLLKELWAAGDIDALAEGVLGASDLIWGEDLNLIPGLTDMVVAFLDSIQRDGMLATVQSIL